MDSAVLVDWAGVPFPAPHCMCVPAEVTSWVKEDSLLHREELSSTLLKPANKPPKQLTSERMWCVKTLIAVSEETILDFLHMKADCTMICFQRLNEFTSFKSKLFLENCLLLQVQGHKYYKLASCTGLEG